MGGANIDKIRKLDEQASMDKINAQNGVLAGNGQKMVGRENDERDTNDNRHVLHRIGDEYIG
jgi:hypothetical protein